MKLEPSTTAFLFPGQGSQTLGMGEELAANYPLAQETFEQADHSLDFPISHLAWHGPENDLNDTINTQPALMVHSVASLRVFQTAFPDFRPAFVAGHSMGELSALVASQALPFEDALRLVRTRGELMKAAGENAPGGMAAILGLDIPTLERICAEASQGEEIVQVANDNCPGQVVISGSNQALQRALHQAEQAGARRAVPLAVSIAAHSPLMNHAQVDFNLAVDQAPISSPEILIIGNVSARPLQTADDVRQDLQAQLNSRVRWTESIQFMITNGVTTFVEMGTGSVLSGLLRRIDRQAKSIAFGTPSDFDQLTT
jgi:[acyl-carrier-protein] S-malonyltransferase